MVKKPSLADLAQKKPTAPAVPDNTASLQATSAGPGKRAGSQPDGRKGILIRVNPEGWKELRDLAADLTIANIRAGADEAQVSMQSLIVDAINRLLQENGRPPVA